MTESNHNNPATVLVVEDDERMRHVTCARLGSLGYRVLEADAAAAAIDLLARHPEVDLLFSDLVMPGEMSGIELARRVRELYPAMPIVLTSGYAAELLHGVEEDLGMQVLHKPYTLSILVHAIRDALQTGHRDRPVCRSGAAR
jgi:CheY-like chemotaxis protein